MQQSSTGSAHRSSSRSDPSPSRGRVRSGCTSRRRGSATPTSTPLAAIGPSSRSLPLVPVMKASGSSTRSATGVTRVMIGQRVAIPWLGGADGTCEFCVKGSRRTASAHLHRLHRGRRLSRVLDRERRLRRSGPRRHRPARGGAALLRRCDHVQGREGGQGRSIGPGRHRRHRRARPPRVCSTRRSRARSPWRSTWTTPSSTWRRSSAPTT